MWAWTPPLVGCWGVVAGRRGGLELALLLGRESLELSQASPVSAQGPPESLPPTHPFF